MTAALGTVDAVSVAEVTGQAMTMQEGDETIVGNASVILTGIDLTITEGSLKTVIWNPVNTGSTSTWTEVNQGSTSGWTEVDTAA
jgi:hypothetical protein